MTNYNKVHDVEQDATSDSNHHVADNTNGRDHTDNLSVPLQDADDSQVDLTMDGYDVKYLLQPGSSNDAIATGAAIVAVFLVALVTATAAIAVAIIAVALVSCLRICSKRERGRVQATYGRGLKSDSSEEKAEQDGCEAGLDN